MAALNTITVFTQSQGPHPRDVDIHLTSVASAAFYKAYLDIFANSSSVSTASNQRVVKVAAQNGGAGNPDVIHIDGGVIPDTWPGVSFVLTALDSNSANESTASTAGTMAFSR